MSRTSLQQTQTTLHVYSMANIRVFSFYIAIFLVLDYKCVKAVKKLQLAANPQKS